MYDTIDNSIVTAVFVALINQQQDETQVTEYLDELQFLAMTAGVETPASAARAAHSARRNRLVGEKKFRRPKPVEKTRFLR